MNKLPVTVWRVVIDAPNRSDVISVGREVEHGYIANVFHMDEPDFVLFFGQEVTEQITPDRKEAFLSLQVKDGH